MNNNQQTQTMNQNQAQLLVVTRHQALVAYLQEICPEMANAQVLSHVNDPATLAGKIVVGVLPLHLAAEAAMVIEVPLALRPEDRGRELGLDEVKARAGKARAYQVRRAWFDCYDMPPEAWLWLSKQRERGWLE